MAEEGKSEKVQCFGRKKTAVAVALVRTGSGQVRMNGCPLHTIKPDILRIKVYEPLLLLGKDRAQKVDIRLRVKGGGFTSQIYAMRHADASPRNSVGDQLGRVSRNRTVELFSRAENIR